MSKSSSLADRNLKNSLLIAVCLWTVSSPGVTRAQGLTSPISDNSADQANTTPATSVQPAMIPFNPSAPPNRYRDRYQALELPPPTGVPPFKASLATGTLPSSTPGIPRVGKQPHGGEPHFHLPDAKQISPRLAPSDSTSSQGNNPTGNTSSNFPPIPDLNSLQLKSSLNSSIQNMSYPLGGNRAANVGSPGSLVGFQSLSTQAPAPVATEFQASHLIAIVGTERVLAGDLAAMVEPIIFENRAKISSRLQEEEVRQSLTRQALPQYVELKAMSQEFFRDMAGNVPPQEMKKMREQVTTRASRMFYERYVPLELFKRYKVEDLTELDRKLRETNLSVSVLKNYFLIQALSAQLEEKYVSETYEIPPDEILEYYQQNIHKWQIPARARWRQLSVRFDRCDSESAAQNQITEMGNEVVLGGKPFEAVARDSSHGFTAQQGGMHDWTFEGSLKSTELNNAIFGLPPNRLSNIIRDEVGLHIIEVVQRESARTKDMAEIQAEIRKVLSKERRQKEADQFREKVLNRVVVWSRWPDDIPGSRPLSEALGEMSDE